MPDARPGAGSPAGRGPQVGAGGPPAGGSGGRPLRGATGALPAGARTPPPRPVPPAVGPREVGPARHGPPSGDAHPGGGARGGTGAGDGRAPRALPAGRPAAAHPRSPLPPGWPRWLTTAEEALVRALVAALVLLVVVQSLIAGRGQLAADTYGRVLEDWGYAPAGGPLTAVGGDGPAGLTAGSWGRPGDGSGGTSPPAAAPGDGPAPATAGPGGVAAPAARPPAAGAGDAAGGAVPGAGSVSALPGGRPAAAGVVTLAGRGPGWVVVELNGVVVVTLGPGEHRPVAVRPGDRLVLRQAAGTGATVAVRFASPELAAPRPGQDWTVGRAPVVVDLAWVGSATP